MAILMSATVLRHKSTNYKLSNKPDFDIFRERKKREEKLSPEELERYLQALEDVRKNPEYPAGMIDGGAMARHIAREKDAVIGAFLGRDVREYPDYQSPRVIRMRESMLPPEKLAKYKQVLDDFAKDPGYPEGMVDGAAMARFKVYEKDAIIGSFLGQDIRRFPDYNSKRFPKTPEQKDIEDRTR